MPIAESSCYWYLPVGDGELPVRTGHDPAYTSVLENFDALEDSTKQAIYAITDEYDITREHILVTKSQECNAYAMQTGATNSIFYTSRLLSLNSEREIVATTLHECWHIKNSSLRKGAPKDIAYRLFADIVGWSVAYCFHKPVNMLLSMFVARTIPTHLRSIKCLFTTRYSSMDEEYNADKNSIDAGYGTDLIMSILKGSGGTFLYYPDDFCYIFTHPSCYNRMLRATTEARLKEHLLIDAEKYP